MGLIKKARLHALFLTLKTIRLDLIQKSALPGLCLCSLLFGMGLHNPALAQLPAPDVITETNASDWGVAAVDGIIAHEDNTSLFHEGSASIRVVATGGFDTRAWTPLLRNAGWDMSDVILVRLWIYAKNPNTFGFQNNSPWIRLGSSDSDYIELRPTSELLNLARDTWLEMQVPVNGDDVWIKSEVGTPDLSHINFFEIHADTWEFGFEYSLDGLAFLTVLDGPFERDDLELYDTWQ